jgi:hypothetical protein
MKKGIFYKGVLLILFLTLVGCVCTIIETNGVPPKEEYPLWGDIALETFDVASSYNDLNWMSVQPAEATDYWELWESGYDQPLAKVGEKCSKATNVGDCVIAFDALRPNTGPSDPLCNSYLCRSVYIRSNQSDNNRLWDTTDKLKDFLGTINSKEEAILLARGYQFHVVPSEIKFGGGFREIDGEYELIALKMVSAPDSIKRYLIRIKPSGELIVLREQDYKLQYLAPRTVCGTIFDSLL